MGEPNSRRPDQTELERLKEAVSGKGGRTMVRSEVLSWNRRWSASDKDTLVRHLGRVGAVRFRGVPGDTYVRCFDAQDRIAMVIAPGYLTFPRHWVNDECAPDWPGIALSTFGLRAAPAPAAKAARAPRTPRATTPKPVEKAPSFCPRCFLQLTPSGACPSCD